MLYKIFLTYPDALRPAFPRLKEKLEDPDPGKIIFGMIYGRRLCSLRLIVASFFQESSLQL